MIKYNNILQKPNSATSWNKLLTDAIIHEINTIGIVRYKGTLSADGLSQYTELVFKTQDDYDNYFKNNSLLLKWHSDKNEHNTLNGINTIYENTETITEYNESGLSVTDHEGNDSLSMFET